MLTCFRRAVVVLIVVALLPVGGGVAVADPVGLPDVLRSVDTVGCEPTTSPPKNCLHLTALLTSMTINPVPNMAATPFTRESFVTGTATETIDGDTESVKSVDLKLGVQVGCQINLESGMQIGINDSNDLGFVDINSVLTGPDVNLTPGATLLPSFTFTLKPGKIVTNDLAEKKIDSVDKAKLDEIEDPTGKITIHVATHEWEVEFDQCGGPVSARLIAAAQVSTPDSNENVVAFGDIVQI